MRPWVFSASARRELSLGHERGNSDKEAQEMGHESTYTAMSELAYTANTDACQWRRDAEGGIDIRLVATMSMPA